ncbi:hypothetical protein PSACC_00708, partial [Paramicrosporidium saccamoebae]
IDYPMQAPHGRFLGAHVSAAGGVWNAFENAHKLGCHSFALFLKNQRRWDSPALKPEDIEKFKAAHSQFSIPLNMILPHGSYLINLGNPDPAVREKSYEAFRDDVGRCHALGLDLYNIHPGSTVGKCSVKESIEHIAKAINSVHAEVPSVRIVLETMAGQGNTIGNKFEDLRRIIDRVNDQSRVGVCIDTCHIFAAGYDIRTRKAYEKTMDEFERTVGFKYLRAVHLNDSKTGLGSGKDRHENIGKGAIGINAFQFLVTDSRFKDIPIILETPLADGPDGELIYRDEIHTLYKFLT